MFSLFSFSAILFVETTAYTNTNSLLTASAAFFGFYCSVLLLNFLLVISELRCCLWIIVAHFLPVPVASVRLRTLRVEMGTVGFTQSSFAKAMADKKCAKVSQRPQSHSFTQYTFSPVLCAVGT